LEQVSQQRMEYPFPAAWEIQDCSFISSRSKGGDTYLDPDLLKIVDGNNFEKISDRMTASLNEGRIDEFVNVLQEKFNDSVSLSPPQYEVIKGEIPKKEPRT
jgi:hypothetical protein